MILDARPGREVRRARKSCMPTQARAAKVCGLGLTAYRTRETDPELFSIDQLKRLYDHLGDDGRDTLRAWITSIFN